MATGMLRRRLLKKTILENGSQKSGLEMDAEAKENASTWGSWDPRAKGKKAAQEVAITSVQGGNLGHEDKISLG